jgi:hypothetical protein
MVTQEIEYTSRYGTKFSCATRNLSTDIDVTTPKNLRIEHLTQDIFEFGAWHAMQIWPTLESFQGYDTVRFLLKQK